MVLAVRLYSDSPERTAAIAALIAEHVSFPDVIALKGDLGAGKTCFVKHFVQSLGNPEEEVTSPTFNLINTYPLTKGWNLWHFDLYRLKNIDEALAIGVEDALDTTICLIEWPEIIEEILPMDYLEIEIKFGKDSNARILDVNVYGEWQHKLENIDFSEFK